MTTVDALSSLFGTLFGLTGRRPSAAPGLDYARLSDHDLDDLNLPTDLKAKVAWERTRDAIFRY